MDLAAYMLTSLPLADKTAFKDYKIIVQFLGLIVDQGVRGIPVPWLSPIARLVGRSALALAFGSLQGMRSHGPSSAPEGLLKCFFRTDELSLVYSGVGPRDQLLVYRMAGSLVLVEGVTFFPTSRINYTLAAPGTVRATGQHGV